MKYTLIDFNGEAKDFYLSFTELKDSYEKFINMSNEEFIKNIHKALHLAIVICWVKKLPSERVLSDIGIIHELAHLLDVDIINDPTIDLDTIREKFKFYLKMTSY